MSYLPQNLFLTGQGRVRAVADVVLTDYRIVVLCDRGMAALWGWHRSYGIHKY
jgi:hypothetical protein